MPSSSKPCRHHDDRLATLPTKLQVRIFSLLSRHDLCSVSTLNKHYHALADAVLYKTMEFLTPELHLIFSESLNRRPRRGSAIQDAKLAYPASTLSHLISDMSLPYNAVSQTISRMSNLETLDLAVPVSLLHSVGHLFNSPFDLACLKSCTLFYQDEDDRYWDLQENIYIFAHPTLETLVIKRAKLDDRGLDTIERPHETALSKLHLIDCDINDDALSDLLVLPKALKEFVMTHEEDPSPEHEESSDSIRDYIAALRPACHSLETITIDSPSLRGSRALAMRDFAALKTLRLSWDHQLYGRTTKRPRLHSVGLPPVLETLEFFRELGTDDEVTDLLVNTIESVEVVARHLRELIVTAEEYDVPRDVLMACKTQRQLYLHIIGGDEEEDEDML